MLPIAYSEFTSYFRDALFFLEEFQWLFDFSVTELLVKNVFDEFPPDWKEVLHGLDNDELNIFPSGALIKECWPPTLVDFCKRCQQLKMCIKEINFEQKRKIKLENKLQRRLTLKKQHEVMRLAETVHTECLSKNITRVLDVGAGMGYLGQVLHHWYGYQILGLEFESDRVDAATKRQLSVCPDSGVQYLECSVSADSVSKVESAVADYLLHSKSLKCKCGLHARQKPFSTPDLCNVANKSEATHGVCMVGLHACGDLSVDAMQLFLKIPSIRVMVLVPCCYHKLERVSVATEKEVFRSFPLSSMLSDMAAEKCFLRRPFLRLAAQETFSRWQHCSAQDHETHSLQVVARAVLELYAHKEGLQLKKLYRRGVRKLNRQTFDAFIDDALERYGLLSDSETNIKEEVMKLWQQYQDQCQLAEILTALQMMLQPVAEALILLDRAAYLQENASLFSSCEAVKIMDDELSPRCIALIARK